MKTESEGDEKLQALNCWGEKAEIAVNPKRLFETMKAGGLIARADFEGDGKEKVVQLQTGH